MKKLWRYILSEGVTLRDDAYVNHRKEKGLKRAAQNAATRARRGRRAVEGRA